MSINLDFFDFIECQQLYNILNSYDHGPLLSDQGYMTLFVSDVRDFKSFEEDHIFTAKLLRKKGSSLSISCLEDEFELNRSVDIKCHRLIVVYDSNSTKGITEYAKSPAARAVKFLHGFTTKSPVRLLNGGYEAFSKLYPYTRDKKILYLPKDLYSLKLYPLECLGQFLYLGTNDQCTKDIIIPLQISLIINCTKDYPINRKHIPEVDVIDISLEDSTNEDMTAYFSDVCDSIFQYGEKNKKVLIVSKNGYSRNNTIAIAFLIKYHKMKLRNAYIYLCKVNCRTRLNWNFLVQLKKLEANIFALENEEIDEEEELIYHS